MPNKLNIEESVPLAVQCHWQCASGHWQQCQWNFKLMLCECLCTPNPTCACFFPKIRSMATAIFLIVMSTLASGAEVLADNFLHGIRNTSSPRLAYSTWCGWYMDGGLNETVLYSQALAMSSQLKPFGWNLILHDYGWQECGSTFKPENGCIRVDPNGRLFPDGERYPSSALPGGRDGDFKPFTDRVHALGLGFGLHLIHGIPKLAVQDALPILGSPYTAADIADRSCSTFIPDHFAVNATHPGAQAYYDSVIAKFAQWGIDFV